MLANDIGFYGTPWRHHVNLNRGIFLERGQSLFFVHEVNRPPCQNRLFSQSICDYLVNLNP